MLNLPILAFDLFGSDIDTGIIIATANVAIAVLAGITFKTFDNAVKIQKLLNYGIKGLMGVSALTIGGLGIVDAQEAADEEAENAAFRDNVTTALADLLVVGSGAGDMSSTRSLDEIVASLPPETRRSIVHEKPILAVSLPSINEPAPGEARDNAVADAPKESPEAKAKREAKEAKAMKWYKAKHPDRFEVAVRALRDGDRSVVPPIVKEYESQPTAPLEAMTAEVGQALAEMPQQFANQISERLLAAVGPQLTDQLATQVEQTLASALPELQRSFETMAQNAVNELAQNLANAAGNAANQAANAANQASNAANDATNQAGNAVNNGANSARNSANNAANRVNNSASNATNQANNAASNAANEMGNRANNAANSLPNPLNNTNRPNLPNLPRNPFGG